MTGKDTIMRRLLLALAGLALLPSLAFGQAVIVPSPVPALTNGCTLMWQTGTSTWICAAPGAASQPLTDSVGLIADDADATKILAFQLSGLTTSTTRTWTIPDANITIPSTIAQTGGVNTFTGLQTMNAGIATTTLSASSTISSAVSVALTGTTNNLGTITSGVWNAGAVTSSGAIATSGAGGIFNGAAWISNAASTGLSLFGGAGSYNSGFYTASGGLLRFVSSVSGTPTDTLTLSEGAATFAGGISGTTGSFSGDFAVATTKFTVASATGNTVVAGALGVGGAVGSFPVKISVAAATTNAIEFAIGGTTETYIGVSGSVGGVIAGSSLGDTVIRNEGGSILLSSDSGTTAGIKLTGAGNTTLAGTLTAAGTAYIGDTANAFATLGLTINQGAADNEILTLKSSDVAHALTTDAEADTYFAISKASPTVGGAALLGLVETGIDHSALTLRGSLTDAADTTKTTSGHGIVRILSGINNSGTAGVAGTDANLLTIENHTTTRFIFDAEGSAHADVEWTTFDDFDDLALLRGLNVTPDARISADFGGYLSANRQMLQDAKIVNYYDPQGRRAMVNTTRLQMLQVGALLQLDTRLTNETAALYARIAALEAEVQSLKGVR